MGTDESTKNFEYVVNLLQEVPKDTVFVSYTNLPYLFNLVQQLQTAGHVYVVSPKHLEIAMSKQAAIDIGLMR